MYKVVVWLVLFCFDIENYIWSVVIAYFFSMYNIVMNNAIVYRTNNMINQCF